MVIDVNKSLTEKGVYDAVTKLVALDLLVPEAPVLVLQTNSADDWRFFWFESKRQRYYIRVCVLQVTTPSEGFAFILDWLTHTSFHDNSDFTVPDMSQPVKRRKLDVLLPWIRDGKHGGGKGIHESLEQYFDIAGVLGPVVEMARAVATRMVTSIPGYPGDE